MIDVESPNLTGADLETLIKDRAVEYKNAGLAHITKCGVQTVRTKDDFIEIRSLPDFEGVTSSAVQFIFDCKVCSQSSFDLSKYRPETKGSRSRQLRHMYDRSRFSVPCFFLLHWNARAGKTFSEPSETYLFPVDQKMEFWQAFDAAEVKRITREDCEKHAVRCEWSVYGRGRTLRPDILPPILDRIETGIWAQKQESHGNERASELHP